MTSFESPKLVARIERWPIAGSFIISRGAKTEAVTVMAELSHGGHTGRGECVPYARYGETPEATVASARASEPPKGIRSRRSVVRNERPVRAK